MEVNFVGRNGIHDEAIFSVRSGTVKRQAVAGSNKPFRFPVEQKAEQEGLLKFDLLTRVGTGYIVLKPFDAKYRVAFDDNKNCEVEVKWGDGKNNNEIGSPGSPKEEEVNAASKSVGAKDAQDYLEKHGVLTFVQAMIQAVIKERPADPYLYMGRQFLQGYDSVQTTPIVVQTTPIVAQPAGSPIADPIMQAELPPTVPAQTAIHQIHDMGKATLEKAQQDGSLLSTLSNIKPQPMQDAKLAAAPPAPEAKCAAPPAPEAKCSAPVAAEAKSAAPAAFEASKAIDEATVEELAAALRALSAEDAAKVRRALAPDAANRPKVGDTVRILEDSIYPGTKGSTGRLKQDTRDAHPFLVTLSDGRSLWYGAAHVEIFQANRPKVGDTVRILEDSIYPGTKGSTGRLKQDTRDAHPFLVTLSDGRSLWYGAAHVEICQASQIKPVAEKAPTQSSKVPEDAERIRNNAKMALEAACLDGTLDNALTASPKAIVISTEAAALRNQAKKQLEKGLTDGSLKVALEQFSSKAKSSPSPPPSKNLDNIRREARDVLEKAAQDGSLETSLNRVQVALDMDVVREKVREALEKGQKDGKLEEWLKNEAANSSKQAPKP